MGEDKVNQVSNPVITLILAGSERKLSARANYRRRHYDCSQIRRLLAQSNLKLILSSLSAELLGRKTLVPRGPSNIIAAAVMSEINFSTADSHPGLTRREITTVTGESASFVYSWSHIYFNYCTFYLKYLHACYK